MEGFHHLGNLLPELRIFASFILVTCTDLSHLDRGMLAVLLKEYARRRDDVGIDRSHASSTSGCRRLYMRENPGSGEISTSPITRQRMSHNTYSALG
jgi:hypothetical protein